jgi:hypothetical protein
MHCAVVIYGDLGLLIIKMRQICAVLRSASRAEQVEHSYVQR